MRRFTARWLPLRDACGFIARHHRHHVPAQGGIVALGLWEGERLVGVSMIGRPVSRSLQAQGVAEVTRLCVLPEAREAASALLSRSRRVAQSLGFKRLVTYTLAEEGGASLRAAGWQSDLAEVGGREWSCPSLPRAKAQYPLGKKVRWWADLGDQSEMRV